MIGAEDFGANFQRVLLRTTITDPGLRALVRRFVQAGQLGWTDPASAWAWRVIAGTDYPTVLQLETEAARLSPTDPARAGVAAIVASPDVREDDYVRGRVVEWCRKQVFHTAFEEARAPYNAGDMDTAYRGMMARMEEMQSIRLDVADRGWFFEDLDERQDRRRSAASGDDAFPIGLDPLDNAMNGGLHLGELEVPLAYSGIGKTFYCVQRGFTCARSRRRAIHFILEGGRGKTEDRYEACWSEVLYSEVRRGDIDAPKMTALRREYEILRGNLVTRGFADRTAWAITYDDIVAELADLRRAHGWVPHMVIVDYGDLVAAPGENTREQQKTAFRQLKSLSERIEFRGHRGYAVTAPSQAVRPAVGADEREHVLKPRDVADCYEKVRVADAIVSLNRTLAEKDDEWIRIFLGKYRDAEDGIVVKAKTDYKRGRLTVFGTEVDYTAQAFAPPAPKGSSMKGPPGAP